MHHVLAKVSESPSDVLQGGISNNARPLMLNSLQQVHKIPGITYAQLPLLSSEDESTLPDTWEHQSPKNAEMSFKEKMESLHDPTSTNLYMEG